MEFKIGDRVKIVDIDGDIINSMLATIIGFTEAGIVALKFDEFMGGHTCDNLTRVGYGWFLNKAYLRKITIKPIQYIKKHEF